ncbi:MAG: glycosyltransferase family 2 protein [Promethearchaeota archaeon]
MSKQELLQKLNEIASADLIIIIPARNEEQALSELLPKIIPDITRHVVVVDNGSTDGTAEVSRINNAVVVYEKRTGYGSACLAGINYVLSLPKPPKYICFFDADGQSLVGDIYRVIEPVMSGKTNYCQGSRMSLPNSKSALLPMAQTANQFFSQVLSLIWKQNITDLGPLRAMTWETLSKLNMKTTGYGWTIEMSAKVLKAGIIHYEVPVQYKKRVTGKSKISGNLRTSVRAAFEMSLTLLRIMLLWKSPSANQK